MTPSIMTFSIMAKCLKLSVVMRNVIMLKVVNNPFMLSVVMLNVIMLSVVAPSQILSLLDNLWMDPIS
jgi:hypothetical protein